MSISTPTILRSLAALGAAALLSVPAREAAACWDGYHANVGSVSIRRVLDSAAWNPGDVREAARWGARIGALLPRGAELDVDSFEVTCSSPTGACGSVTALPAQSGDLPGVFQAVASAFAATPSAVRRARAIEPAVYTVQIFAGSARGARGVKDRIEALAVGSHGFFEEGGFPAWNQPVHVLRDGGPGGLHRVIVGTFLTREDAAGALLELKRRAVGGFIRELPGGTPIGEREYSRGP